MSNELKIKKEVLEYSSTDNQKSSSLTVGTILLYAGPDMANISGNFLLCDGQQYSSTDNDYKYNNLFNVIGNMYGGSSPNFQVPNLKRRFAIGAEKDSVTSQAINQISENGLKKISGGVDNILNKHFKHIHAITTGIKGKEDKRDQSYSPEGNYLHGKGSVQANIANRETTNNVDNGGSPVNTNQEKFYPPYCAINYIICYKA